MTNKNLSETRAADRKKMADILEKLITELGAAYTRIDGKKGGYPDHREIQLNIRANRGLCVSVNLDGNSWQPDVYVLSWYIASDSDARLSDDFGGDVNPHHHAKATYIARGFDDLCIQLGIGLTKAATGSAFDLEREAFHIKKNGETAAERQARYAEMKEEWQGSKRT